MRQRRPRVGPAKRNPISPPRVEPVEEDDVSGAAPEEDEPDEDVTGPNSTSEAAIGLSQRRTEVGSRRTEANSLLIRPSSVPSRSSFDQELLPCAWADRARSVAPRVRPPTLESRSVKRGACPSRARARSDRRLDASRSSLTILDGRGGEEGPSKEVLMSDETPTPETPWPQKPPLSTSSRGKSRA